MNAAVDITVEQLQVVSYHLKKGLAGWSVPEPMTLDEWAREHFYLSAESSYVEQEWTPWYFQRAIMACISSDDIAEVDWQKSARVGYTKIILAAIGYFAEHKRRNQVLWQPTDDDAEDFVKSELEPMIRDVEAMQAVFPTYLARHKDNTLQQKKFIGSTLRVKGGKAAKNYRRISADVGYMDELDAFDNDVEKEGDPPTLARKRLEGATFPKFVCGTTPKQKGFSLIEERVALADERFTYQVPCAHCGKHHGLSWGGKDQPHGFKFLPGDPASVRHMCPHCHVLITQAEFLAIAETGVYVNDSGTLHLDVNGKFTTPEGVPVSAPAHIAFHVWTAYSPVVAWSAIVTDFLAAFEKVTQGDDTKMKAWVNTTLGEGWEGEIERTEADELKLRAEPFPLKVMPRGCLLALCAFDVQDNRLEVGTWGYGRGGEMWTLDHQVFFGNPALPEVWAEAEEFLRTQEYAHACGLPQRIFATAIDSGGHHTDAVYAFAHKLKALRVHAIKGASSRERSIENGNSRVSYRWNGKVEKNGPVLWMVGTNLAKDRFQSRLSVTTPGPGYVHFSKDLSDEWFKQIAGEHRALRRTQNGTETRWAPQRKRLEARDILAYVIWLEERLGLWTPRQAKFWNDLEARVQPADDLFAAAALPREPQTSRAQDSRETSISRPPAPVPIAPSKPDGSGAFGSQRWGGRL